jgi:hypothetical protein
MMPIAVCVYCSQKIEEKEKSVNVPHLLGRRCPLGVRPEGNDPNRPSTVTLSGCSSLPPDPRSAWGARLSNSQGPYDLNVVVCKGTRGHWPTRPQIPLWTDNCDRLRHCCGAF